MRALDDLGLLGVDAVARELGVGERQASSYISSAKLLAERVWFEGALKPAWGVNPAELGRFKREWARGGDRRRTAWLDPDVAVDRAETSGHLEALTAKGLREDEARDLIRSRTQRRRKSLAAHRKGRRAMPCALRWSGLLEAAHEAQERDYQERRLAGLIEDGERPPSRMDAAEAAAEQDWLAHPEEWPRAKYPSSSNDCEALDPFFAAAAGRRLYSAVNRLQISVTEKQAA